MKIATVLSLVALFATQASCTIVTQPYSGIKLREQHRNEIRAEINNLPRGNVKQKQQKLAAGFSFPRRR